MSDPTNTAILEVRGLRSGYRGVTVLKGIDMDVGNEVVALLGANGAGIPCCAAAAHSSDDRDHRFQGNDVSTLGVRDG
jgi:ABC-type branched-subunit amino acid transport system ATPase component